MVGEEYEEFVNIIESLDGVFLNHMAEKSKTSKNP